MTNETSITDRYDVLVVGFGPAGAVAAGYVMLDTVADADHAATLRFAGQGVDRLTDIYDKPRAIAIDHEILRHFDNMGVADQVMPYVAPFTASQHFGAKGQLIRRIDMVPEPYPLGYTPSMVFTQPPVEAVLRDHAESFGCVTVSLGVEMVDLDIREGEVIATLKDASGETRQVAARYLIEPCSRACRHHAGGSGVR